MVEILQLVLTGQMMEFLGRYLSGSWELLEIDRQVTKWSG